MKNFSQPVEPASFDLNCRQAGQRFIGGSEKTWRNLWSIYHDDLAEGYGWLCCYGCMKIAKGSVDHFEEKGTPTDSKHPELVYEWSNYRFADQHFNNKKRKRNEGDPKFLDPLLVQGGWFTVSIPSLKLEVSPDIPDEHRASAEHTIKKLGLVDGPVIMRLRRNLFSAYSRGEIGLTHVKNEQPLLGEALEKNMPPKYGDFYIDSSIK